MDLLPLNTSITVGTDPVVVLIDRLGLNSKRIAYILQNTSTGSQKITLSTGKPATAGQGRVLSVGGSEDRTPEQRPPQMAIYAVSDVAGATLSVYEECEDKILWVAQIVNKN